MKKRLLMTTVLCVAMLAAGCSNKDTAATEKGTEKGTEAASTEAAGESEGTSDSETEAAAKNRPEYTALDYVTLGQYKGLEVSLTPIEVTQDEIDSEVNSALTQNEKYDNLEEGKVEDGDIVNIDYEGILEGEAFEGGTDKGYELTIGSGSFIEGFEEGLIGKDIGSDVDLNVTFPEEYSLNPDMAGKEVVFHVTINSAKRLLELTDELAAEISDYKTVDEYRESIKENLTTQKKDTQNSQKLSDLVAQVYQNSTVNNYPQELVDYNMDSAIDYYQSYADQSEMTLSEFLEQNFQMSEEDFRSTLETQVKQSLDQEMILKAVAETENVTISDKEFEEGAAKYAEQSGLESGDALIEQYGEAIIELSLLQDRALEIIEESAVVHGEDASESESQSEEEESETTDSTETEDGSEKESDSEKESGSEKESESETKAE